MSLAAGSPNRWLQMIMTDPYSLLRLLLNISVVGGRSVGSESLTTFDQLLWVTITQAAEPARALYPLPRFPIIAAWHRICWSRLPTPLTGLNGHHLPTVLPR